MKTLLFAFVSFSLFANAESLNCQVHHNTSLVLNQELNLDPKATGKIGEVESYRLYLNNLGSEKFEIEVFDPNGPARLYSAGFLSKTDQVLEFSNWTREILLQVTCRRK